MSFAYVLAWLLGTLAYHVDALPNTDSSVIAYVDFLPNTIDCATGDLIPSRAVAYRRSGEIVQGVKINFFTHNPVVATIVRTGSRTADVRCHADGTTHVGGGVLGKRDSARTKVCSSYDPNTLTVTPDSLLLTTVGDTASATVSLTNACNQTDSVSTITALSRSTAVATVTTVTSRRFLVTATGNGPTRVVWSIGALRDSIFVCVGSDTVVSVAPPTLTVATSETATLTASVSHCGEAIGSTVTWTSRAPSTATVASSGAQTADVTGVASGTAHIVGSFSGGSDSALVTVSDVAPPTAATCFDAGAATITHTGLKAINEVWDRRNHLPANSRIDAMAATWRKNAPAGAVANDMVRFGPGPGNCLHGGTVLGLWNKETEDWETYHSSNAFVADGSNAIIEDVYCENFGDCTKFMGNVKLPQNWTVRRVYGKDVFDDCVENDWQESGRIEDVLFEGCFTFLAIRDRINFPNPSIGADTVHVDKAIVWHRPVPSGGEPGRFWKIDIDPAVGGISHPKVTARNMVVRMDPGYSSSRYCLNEGNNVVVSQNNVLVWTGSGAFGPCGPAPAGWTVLTGSSGLSFWAAAVAQWKTDHPQNPGVP